MSITVQKLYEYLPQKFVLKTKNQTQKKYRRKFVYKSKTARLSFLRCSQNLSTTRTPTLRGTKIYWDHKIFVKFCGLRRLSGQAFRRGHRRIDIADKY